jgi:uncharacterized protein YraI
MKKLFMLTGAVLTLSGFAAHAETTTTIWFVPGTVQLRAGPDMSFPVVASIPSNERMALEGCLQGWSWCDVNWNGQRGWVSGKDIEAIHQNKTVRLSEIVSPPVQVPVVTYNTAAYWDTYYKTTPFYTKRQEFFRWEPAPASSSATSP